MYLVELQYFDKAGYHLGGGSVLSPGADARALAEFIKTQDLRRFCGFSPAYIHATPEVGDPVLVKLEGE